MKLQNSIILGATRSYSCDYGGNAGRNRLKLAKFYPTKVGLRYFYVDKPRREVCGPTHGRKQNTLIESWGMFVVEYVLMIVMVTMQAWNGATVSTFEDQLTPGH